MFQKALVAATAAIGLAGAVNAAIPVYPNIGTANPEVYTVETFTAARTQDLIAYYLGFTTAAYSSQLFVSINGGPRVGPAFPNQTTAPGTSFNFGQINRGDTIEFILDLTAPPNVAANEFSSVTANNPDGVTHIFTTSYGGGDFGIPEDNYIYIAFEDIRGERDANFANDFDYNDHKFAFNLSVIPEPATWALMIAGFGLVGFAARRRRVSSVAA